MNISCLVPARNEQGHLADVIRSIISIENISEIIIIEGGSKDDTYNEAINLTKFYPSKVRVLKQPGHGKFDAIKWGAEHAKEEFLIIWDADGTVPLDSTLAVINHASSTKCVTIGNRLAGEMEPGSMQFFNLIGNWFFAFAWSPILGTKPVDLLCGTKIVPTKIFSQIPIVIELFDPYGDFSLLATIKACGYEINFIPVNYQIRRYGSTNIHRWVGGIQLLGTTFLAYCWFLWRLIKRG
jgi:glycosyltransferase involved in cell wall biosynthesis